MSEKRGSTPSFHLPGGLSAMTFAPVSSFPLTSPPSRKISKVCSVFPLANLSTFRHTLSFSWDYSAAVEAEKFTMSKCIWASSTDIRNLRT
jgi:hypothetical protein